MSAESNEERGIPAGAMSAFCLGQYGSLTTPLGSDFRGHIVRIDHDAALETTFVGFADELGRPQRMGARVPFDHPVTLGGAA